MSYDDKLSQTVDQIRRQISDVQTTELFSDNEIKGMVRRYPNENAAIGHLYLAMASDPVILLELYDRQDGHMSIDRLADMYRTLGQGWLARAG